jgi:DNA repair protein RadD
VILRDYQEAAVQAGFDYLNSVPVGNPLLALPTGTGKSVVIAEFIRRALELYPGLRVLKLTHVKELIQQNLQKLLDHWPTAPVGVYSAGLGRKEWAFPVTLAGIDSAVKQPDLFGYQNLVIIDEAHLVAPKDGTRYQKLIGALKARNPDIRVVGLTATHYRLGQGLLTEEGGLFTDIAFNLTDRASFNWLLERGHLAPLIPKRTNVELDVSDVTVHGGEFVQKELQAAVDKTDVTIACLRETITYGGNRAHWLVFAAGIQHAVNVRDALESLGVEATCVHSKMSTTERDEAIAGFKAGRYQAMVNNGILTTGFDFPGLDMIVVLRPTKSTGLWVQMLGRGTRPAPGKENCLVMDFAGNTKRLGPINDPVLPWRRGGKGGTGHAPVKVCEACGTYCHASVRFCDYCGHEFHVAAKIKEGASTQELIATGPVAVELPKIEKYNVDRVTYIRHRKRDRPYVLKVSYFCGLMLFTEWVCLEHEGYAKKRARDWWRNHTKLPVPLEPPATVEEALTRLHELKSPTRIRVWVNKKHPEVMSYEST